MSLAYPLPWPFETEVFHTDGEIHIVPRDAALSLWPI